MASFGTLAFFRSARAFDCALIASLMLVACSDDADDGAGKAAGSAGMAGATGGSIAGMSGTTGGTGGAPGATGGTGGSTDDAGTTCDERGCWVTLEAFQAESLDCAASYRAAQTAYQEQPGADCTYAFFSCGGLDGAAYQYGFTGDNVQCYYDQDGALVGAVRTSDHGPSTLAGEVPSPGCYAGPDCSDGDAGVDGGVDDLRACNDNSDCALSETTCCPCGEPEPSEITAVRADRLTAFRGQLCALPVACPDIACFIEERRYVATCDAGTCKAVDLTQHASTECEQPSDCNVRTAGCCPCGGEQSPGNLVAISDENAFASLVCDAQLACAQCAPIYPSEATTTCGAQGHCVLTDAR